VALRQAVTRLPGTLATTRTTLGDVTAFANQLGPTATALLPTAKRLPTTLRNTETLFNASALLPLNQLVMLKLLCNQPAEAMGLAASRTLGTIFDGMARNSQEGRDFVERALEGGFRQAVRDRDDPFQDYGSGPRGKRGKD